MNLFELSAKISVDDSNFKKSMENAQKVSKNVANAIKQLQSPLDKAKSGFNAIAHPVETAKANIEKLKNATESIRHPIETFKNKVAEASTALETKRNKLSTLAAGYDSAKKKVDDLTKEFNKSAKESGTSSQKTQELAKKLNEAENEAEEAKKELDDYSASVSKAGKNSDSASKSVGNFASKLGKVLATAGKGVGNFASKLGKGLATAGKVAGAALGVAVTSITALTTAAVNNYAEYEQLAGGIETLFEDLSWDVGQNAAKAFQTAGLSANEYMETAMSFAASLNQSLTRIDGNIARSAELTDQAIIDMADNANKMGTDIGMIQNAYQGFAKQNYTMLDNLKLGYGGTAEEMYRLLKRAAELDETFAKTANFSIDSKGHLEAEFADITQAIHIVQTEMGITGTTALEAGRTISGSVGAMKSAWTNLITGLADGNADIGQLVDNLVTTVVGDGTENNLGVLGNIMPAVKTALGGVAKLVSEIIPELGKYLPVLVEEVFPLLIQSATSLFQSIAQAVPELLPILIDAIIMATPDIITGIVTAYQSIIEILPDLIQQIADALPTLVPQIVVGLGLLAIALAEQMPEIFASVADAMVNLFAGAWDGIKRVFSLDKVQQFFSDVWQSAQNAFGSVASWFEGIFSDAWQAVKDVFSTGGRIFDGIKDGIVNAFKTIVNGIIGGINKVIAVPFNAINGVLRKIKNVNIVGIRPFDWIQTFTVPQIPKLWRGGVLERGQIGLLEGSGAEAVVPLENNAKWISKVADEMQKSVGSFGGNVYNVEINIDGAKYDDEQSLAEAIAFEIQKMTDRRAAVYA